MAAAACSIENGIISGLSPSDIAKVRGGGVGGWRGEGEVREEGLGIGDETERWDAKRETDRCRAGEIQIFARIPGGSTATPFNNNLYYFNDLRPRVSVTFVRRPRT